MPPVENISRCDLCGAPLKSSAITPGCLNCLLLGRPDESDQGTRLFQHYEICLREDGITLDELGRGAMGITYRARDLSLDSPVALKIISARHSRDPETRARFQREARAAAQLRHANVASVFHFGETAEHQLFYAMELVEGETLEARVRRDGPLPAALGLEVGLQVARALVAAEAHNLVHRDLKPSNLMVEAGDASGTDALVVKVIDFGLAKPVAILPPAIAEPHRGFSGTPDFASPEQFSGRQVAPNVRSDIYSLGATLWYLLCGQAPFSDRVPGERQPLRLEQLSAFHVPSPIVDLLCRMLAEKPAERPESARALWAALQSCREILAATPRRRRRRRLVGLGLLLISLLGLTIYFSPRSRSTGGASAIALPPPEKSIAVLPFENLGDEKEDTYFAAGVQGEILTNLAKIADLKVISRSSTMQYESGIARDVRQIGQELGVAHLLEGSVQRHGRRVRVNVRLIDASNEAQLWAQIYERDLANLFAIQSEIAQAIAGSLQAKLTGLEAQAVEAEPTKNAAAYDAYLRARQLETNPDTLLEDFKVAEQLYARAVSLDPGFALAHARLAQTNAEIFHFHERTEPWKIKAKTEAEEALRLQPNLAEGHHALGLYLYWVESDYERALQEFEHAFRLAPGWTEPPFLIAAIRRRQGRWRDTLAAYNRLAAQDPRNPNVLRNLVYTHTALRDWPEATHAAKRWRAIALDSVTAKIQEAYIDFWWHGKTAALKTALKTIPQGVDPDGVITATRWDVAMIERDYATAKNALLASPLEELSYLKIQPTPKSFLLGALELARGDAASAQTLLESARAKLESAVQEAPGNAERHANLGLVYAFLGRKQEAVRQGLLAVELKPEAKDALDGTVMSCYLALIYTRVGKSDLAIPLIERLLQTPGAVDSADYSLTTSDLKFRWEWDPLRDDPRFEKLVASRAPGVSE